ncbi:hypothetical protein D3C71_1851030 [compost metagenome]
MVRFPVLKLAPVPTDVVKAASLYQVITGLEMLVVAVSVTAEPLQIFTPDTSILAAVAFRLTVTVIVLADAALLVQKFVPETIT